jgi:hypothetical protein
MAAAIASSKRINKIFLLLLHRLVRDAQEGDENKKDKTERCLHDRLLGTIENGSTGSRLIEFLVWRQGMTVIDHNTGAIDPPYSFVIRGRYARDSVLRIIDR